MSLDALAEQILGVQMDKHWTTRCSNWEAEKLTERQADYAMNDALVAVHIFLKLVEAKGKGRQNPGPLNNALTVGASYEKSISEWVPCQIGHGTDNDGDAAEDGRVGEGASVVDGLDVEDKGSMDSVGEDSSLGSFGKDYSHGSDKAMNQQPFLEGEKTQDTAALDVGNTIPGNISSCRKRNIPQPEGSAVLGDEQSGNPGKTTMVADFEFSAHEDSEESYYERLVFIDKWETKPGQGYVENITTLLSDRLYCQRAISLCQGITDMDFKAPQKNTQKKSRVVEFSSEKAKCKPYKRGTIRKTPLYSKSMLVAPDGAILCTVDRKKADWYILKGIGMLFKTSSQFFMARDESTVCVLEHGECYF